MAYRRFGRTGLRVSVFSLGTMRALATETLFRQTVERAVALGVNHLETAQGYGQGEVYLGRAVRAGLGRPRPNLIVTTKIPPQPTYTAMAETLERSLERLGLDYVDCVAIHGLNTAEHLTWVLNPEGCMAAVRAMQAAGRIRHIGFSTHGPLEIILAAIQSGQFAFVNLLYSLFHPRNRPAVALAADQDMGVFIISPSDKGGQFFTPPSRLVDLCAPYPPWAVNYRWLLSDPRITTLSLGAAHPAELDAPLAWGEQIGPLTENECAVLDRLAQVQADALGSDQCHQCHACLPCPEAIAIPDILRLRNLAVAYDMTGFGKYRYAMLENAGHWFPGRRGDRCTDCGDCLPRCPTHLPIPSLLRDTHQRLQGPAGRRLWQD
ncbi:MAG: aldo/keto reductase [Gloeomargaritaceae cyanobacterium C42_A2020_066]|nr:aldo/keto reductase [Gloeomargaritaceae cyanobacterium C42_A2020_066]